MKKQANKIYKNLQRKRKAIKIKAFLMSGFLLAINTFAWFVFIANGDGHIKADVISWDIAFLDENEQVEILSIELDDLYPGMPTYSKDIVVKNQSDLNATFSFEVESVIVYGTEYKSDDYIASLENEFPFSITFTHDKTDLSIGEKLNFTVNANWPFESSEQYFKLNELYPYMDSLSYYTYTNDTYTEVTVTEENYDVMLTNGLYVESDDADTYWGEKSVTYKQENPGVSSIVLKVKLVVTQVNSN